MSRKRDRVVARATKGETSIAPEVMPPHINWAVMWLKGDRVIEKWCDDDFSEAMRVYDLARESGRKAVTLRCANYAFPPPKRYTEKEVIERKRVKRKGKIKIVRVRTVVNAVRELNARGWWWCPYCIKFRQFEKQDGFLYEEIFVPRIAYYCPMCGISHHDGAFKKFNPLWYKLDPRRRVRKVKASGRAKRRR